MQTTFEAKRLSPPPGGSVVSIGVFDGVHLGHQAILARNVEVAREESAVPTVVTFRRHPKKVLLGRSPKQITTLEYRIELFRRLGIEHVVALNFDQRLRDLSAADFTRELLVEGLAAKRFVLGFDSKFGRGREGSPAFLESLGHRVEVAPKVVVDQRPVSSTAIREAVELGDLSGAAAMLGRPVSVLGRVVHGDALGRRLGFPTANLNLMQGLHPPTGVYACWARVLADDETRPRGPALRAVTNIGFRPTVTDGSMDSDPRVEVHLLDDSMDLYGRRIEVEFAAALRGEMRFDSVDDLVAQIALDVRAARERLSA
ncbi:bifunctional riboflavin kinase/FMN adenylyltransferase [Engelhardtia mirabilis]|uniref:Riboflavin biosynthesis protein n=1 Tax=Engelhardtia mirabilis TaxID=2528011 RepID=A0A518BRL5_9BACT|nr:Riboflavin kinase [Planctomycetes bacterium Pla133]QDV03947.1 Riboflavin kinase [Planctomycetes bacterium Pla86]